jgi:cytochrome c
MHKSALTALAALAALTLSHSAFAADAAAGEKVFKTQCSACHATEAGKNRVGPSLAGVVGRTAGAVEGFKYSAANKGSGITWTAEVLDKYIDNPKGVVPGTIMPYAGLHDAGQRADLIAYLETLK